MTNVEEKVLKSAGWSLVGEFGQTPYLTHAATGRIITVPGGVDMITLIQRYNDGPTFQISGSPR